MQFLYPQCAFEKAQVDAVFSTEYTHMQQLGFACHLVDDEQLLIKNLVKNKLTHNDKVIYRGWMMSLEQYQTFEKKLSPIELLTDGADYAYCHHLPRWYDDLHDLTAKTICFSGIPTEKQLENSINELNWSAYFIKDFVKSNYDKRGSVAKNLGEIKEIIALLGKYRCIEGGICLREFEHYQHDTEERYFVYQGKIFSPNGCIPAFAHEVAERINVPFFSMDIIKNIEGQYRLVELGDGQVSDLKTWDVARFCELFQ